MFGPNSTPGFHHRGDHFKELYQELEEYFLGIADLDPREWRVFFITGSGTLANEIMMYSSVNNIHVTTKGHFSDRFYRYLNSKNKIQRDFTTGKSYNQIGCVYETSESKYNDTIKIQDSYSSHPIKLILADCVSSFPYYDIPDEVDIWTTVSGKQLGCSPGVSMIVAKRDIFYSNLIKPVEESYLSLAKYALNADRLQTPNTPAINILEELLKNLKSFHVCSFRNKIYERRKKLVKLLPNNSVIGEGPVLTLKSSRKILELSRKFKLYNNSSEGPQVFLWSGSNDDYDSLYKELEKVFD